MNRSQRRQFNEYRSHGSSAHDDTSEKLSQSPISEACINCVNVIMAERQKKAQKEEKARERGAFKKTCKMLNSWVDPQEVLRESMKKDALNYNSKQIQTHKLAKKHDRQQQQKYAETSKRNIELSESILHEHFQQEKNKRNQYYQEIQKNYLAELERKNKQRCSKENNKEKKNGGLPLFNADKTQQKIQYRKDLEKQMVEKKQKQYEQKMNTQKLEKQLIDKYNIEVEKYHSDNYQAMTMSKEEVFGGLSDLEKEKKLKAEEKKKINDQQRMRLIKQENQERSRIVKQKMKQMKNYVEQLKKQLQEKEERLRSSKRQQINFMQKLPKSTQQIHAQMQQKKTCKHCHKKYPQQFIGPVPKKS